jgi:hypothetical protein
MYLGVSGLRIDYHFLKESFRISGITANESNMLDPQDQSHPQPICVVICRGVPPWAPLFTIGTLPIKTRVAFETLVWVRLPFSVYRSIAGWFH